MYREPTNVSNDYVQCEAFKACQDKYVKNSDTYKDQSFFP